MDYQTNEVAKKLKEARDLLIDVGGSNRLLNYKPTKKRTIPVSGHSAVEVYRHGIINEGTFKLFSRDEADSAEPLASSRSKPIRPDKPESSDRDASNEPRELKLHTEFAQPELLSRLIYVFRNARTFVEEQGFTGLHLAICFLNWTESPHSAEKWRSPLLLIPVELKRRGFGPYTVSWTGEEVQTNYALQHKLSINYSDLALPAFEMLDSVNCVKDYLESIRRVISPQLDWEIDESMCLDFFNFTKMVMYRDLDPDKWLNQDLVLDNTLLRYLFDPEVAAPPAAGMHEDDIDKKVDFKARYYVMDADPSQIVAIEDVREGTNLVIQGPPGTGKSQTIVNLIAEMLACGKRVLFVTEKQAALEVVQKRLDDVGLSPFCLSLHSKKASKKEFLEDIKKALDLRPKDDHASPLLGENRDGLFSEHKREQTRLDDYAAALKDRSHPVGKSAFQLYEEFEKALNHFSAKHREVPHVNLQAAHAFDWQSWTDTTAKLQELCDVCEIPPCQSPWNGTHPSAAGPLVTAELWKLLEICTNGCTILMGALEDCHSWRGNQPHLWKDYPDTIQTLRLLSEGAQYRFLNVKELFADAPDNATNDAKDLLEKACALKEERQLFLCKFKETAFQDEAVQLLQDRDKLFSNRFLIFHPIKHWKLQQKLLALFREPPKPIVESPFVELEKHHHSCGLLRADEAGYRFFGSEWQGVDSDLKRLKAALSWGDEIRNLIEMAKLESQVLAVLQSDDMLKSLKETEQLIHQTWKSLQKSHSQLVELIAPDYSVIIGKPLEEATPSELGAVWHQWRECLDQLFNWLVFHKKRESCLLTPARPLIKLLDQGEIEADDLLPAFKGTAAMQILASIMGANDYLKLFSSVGHQATISRFKDLDQKSIKANRQNLVQKLAGEIPELPARPQRGSGEFVLNTEMHRRRNRKPIRLLLSEAGDLILRIKPCVMMSPISVAQFLPAGQCPFDVVIFDEASQVRPPDALGAILRAKQMVVLGDSQQLPPTDFFERVLMAPDDGDGIPLSDMESLLKLCSVAKIPEKSLLWHYRSRHESLIAVSNREFYGNHLKVYPSAAARDDRLGLHFENVKDGVYDKGHSRTNLREAQVVAEQCIQHYREFPELSLGVGTFNLEQCSAIWDAIDALRLKNPDLESFFSRDRKESFFVKNLETIQGDEREVIFISVGYGFDRAGDLSHNFGPLNQDGGERRLNVLITRARRKCLVFANFHAADLGDTKAYPKGVQSLQVFLDCAATGVLKDAPRIGECESPFEESIAEALRIKGITVHPQVGCAGYRIDLAIPHPSNSGNYLLGIECDGAKYHGSAVARERDRLRQQVLEAQGWRILRVWSTDWYLGRAAAESRLLDAVQKAIAFELTKTAAAKIAVAKPGVVVSMPTRAVEPHAPSQPPLSYGMVMVPSSVDRFDDSVLHMVFLKDGLEDDDSRETLPQELSRYSVGSDDQLVARQAEDVGAMVRESIDRLEKKGLVKLTHDQRRVVTEAGRDYLLALGL